MKPEKLIEVLSVAERLKRCGASLLHIRWKAGECCGAFLENYTDGLFCQR